MKPLSILLALAITGAAASHQSKTPAQQVVGTWKYDVSTMKLEPNEKGKKQLNDPKTGAQAKAFVAKMQKGLKTMLVTMKITFKADNTLAISGGTPPSKTSGTW